MRAHTDRTIEFDREVGVSVLSDHDCIVLVCVSSIGPASVPPVGPVGRPRKGVEVQQQSKWPSPEETIHSTFLDTPVVYVQSQGVRGRI